MQWASDRVCPMKCSLGHLCSFSGNYPTNTVINKQCIKIYGVTVASFWRLPCCISWNIVTCACLQTVVYGIIRQAKCKSANNFGIRIWRFLPVYITSSIPPTWRPLTPVTSLHLRHCVGWGVKFYALTNSVIHDTMSTPLWTKTITHAEQNRIAWFGRSLGRETSWARRQLSGRHADWATDDWATNTGKQSIRREKQRFINPTLTLTLTQTLTMDVY